MLTYEETGEWNAIANKLPRVQQDWWDKRRATDTVLDEIGGAVYRNFDWDGPLAFVKKAADLSDRSWVKLQSRPARARLPRRGLNPQPLPPRW